MPDRTPRLAHEDGLRKNPSPEAGEAAVGTVLSDDHERLERQFQAIVAEASGDDPIELREAWRTFEGELLRHFAGEEGEILPSFAQQKPTQARAIVDEHDRIRASLTKLGVDLDLHCLPASRIAEFVEELRAHARHEDEMLYPWAAHRRVEGARHRIRKELSQSEAGHLRHEKWQIDLGRSSLRFSLRHIVIHEIRGQFGSWGGTISLDGHELSRSSVRLWIDLASVDTGVSERDDQIRSAEFFDVGHFPQANFTGTEALLPEHASPLVKGRLALHGITGDVDVAILRHNQWTDAQGVERVSYEVKARFDRRKFGLRWNQDLDVGGVVVGDEIAIVAQLEAVRAQPALRGPS